MARLTFYGGVGEIGGNKFLLDDSDAKVFLDFGTSFGMVSQYFTGYLQPRRVNELGDYLEFNLLPRLRGLYSEESVVGTKLDYCDPEFDGVLLSHAHVDHVGLAHFLDKEIPFLCGEGTKLILDALSESGGYCYGEHQCQTFRTGKKLSAGGIEIQPVHVDHSIPAAYGFIIETASGCLVYSGDLRLHGPMSKMSREFVDKAKNAEPEVMICEGTRINPIEKRSNHSEADVKRLSNQIVKGSKKLAICSFYGRDMDRFKTFYGVAKDNDRKLVISTRMAYLLSKLKMDSKLSLPDVAGDENILVYMKRKGSGNYGQTDYYRWERPFLDKAVTFDYIHENQPNVLLSLDLANFTELVDIRPDGGDFIHSMSEPFSEEDIEANVMHNWLEHFHLKFHQIHASGHCRSQDLKEIIETIGPKKLFPVHSEEPKHFRKVLPKTNIIIPTKKRAFEI
jgi:ribonuclease J